MYKRAALAIAVTVAGLSSAVASTVIIGLNDPTLEWLDGFARAADLPSLNKSTGPKLRIWIAQAKSGLVVGYSLSPKAAVECRTSISDEGHALSIEQAHCGPATHTARTRAVLELLDELYVLDGEKLGCGVSDGEFVDIEGVTRGRRFTFRADNPSLCHDSGSELVAKALSLLRGLNAET